MQKIRAFISKIYLILNLNQMTMKPVFLILFIFFMSGILYAQTTIKLEEVNQHIGDSVTVCGKVMDMRYFENSKNKPTFLNIGARYPNQQLVVVIWENVRSRFTGNLDRLVYKNICITGRIILYKGKPEIIIENPEQITYQ